MLIRGGYDIVFEIPAPTCMLLMLYVHPDRARDLQQPERLTLAPAIPIDDFLDSFGNRCARILAPAGELRITNDFVIRDWGVPDEYPTSAKYTPVEDLPRDILPFLLSSRYCEVDRMSDLAWQLFGQTQPGWPRVRAVCDWAHNQVQFGYEHARNTRTAYEAYEERKGVCRDYMHLAVTMMRCMNVPARYATGYLGDIGVPISPSPMDFSAWFEVYLDGRWYTMDARHNVPRIGRILMARGRDAVDVALTTSFGPTILKKFDVVTDEMK
ncbi:MAG: transglutaminase family protein [Anaerolineae bacterium]|nr:transglutaminase family protein [Phycisphaerae bacterium]